MAGETLDLDELERLAREATPGPWCCESCGEERADGLGDTRLICAPSNDHPGKTQCLAAMEGHPSEYANDAAFIAAANPAAVLALIERLRVAEAAVRVFAKRWSEAVGMCDCCFALADCPDVELPDGYRCEVILCEWADAEARTALGLPEPEVPDGTD